jgi:hypothetical protein
MARIRYTGANGEEPPPTELEQAKLAGQQIANTIAEAKLARLRGDSLDKRAVIFFVENALTIQREQAMRFPVLMVRELRALLAPDLSHEHCFVIRGFIDEICREWIDEFRANLALAKIADPSAAMRELAGVEPPSQQEIDRAAQRKARTNTKRRERRERRKKSTT